ncbi:unnamed protein product [Ceratitis capitata]|uniref:(Mediterranean fruit fly) hypothetical protein n=1 Tax=Ceratitis capitata TaxID=7213 RepID=A0A811U192_CERCA|nr:unnamed protein product [Ceratitis capitata]
MLRRREDFHSQPAQTVKVAAGGNCIVGRYLRAGKISSRSRRQALSLPASPDYPICNVIIARALCDFYDVKLTLARQSILLLAIRSILEILSEDTCTLEVIIRSLFGHHHPGICLRASH